MKLLNIIYGIYSAVLDKVGILVAIVVYLVLWVLQTVFVMLYVAVSPLILPIIMGVRFFMCRKHGLLDLLRQVKGKLKE